MNIKTHYFVTIVFCLFLNSIMSQVMRCYSSIYLNKQNTIKLLNTFWNIYPENRVDELTIQKLEEITHRKEERFSFKDTSACDTCRSIFLMSRKNEEFESNSWLIKSTDGSIVFEIIIANEQMIVNGFNCDICLKSALFTDKYKDNFRSWELPRQKRKLAKKLFKEDILKKLKDCKKLLKNK